MMGEQDASHIKDVAETLIERIVKYRQENDADDAKKREIADTIAELGGGKIFMNYLRFLQEQTSEADVKNYFLVVLHALWNETDDSLKLCIALAENGLFELLKEQLSDLKEKYLTNKKVSVSEIIQIIEYKEIKFIITIIIIIILLLFYYYCIIINTIIINIIIISFGYIIIIMNIIIIIIIIIITIIITVKSTRKKYVTLQ